MCCCCIPCDCCDFLLTILAFICPPLTVGIKRGFCSCDFLINVALSMLGYVPGLIHAWYIILTDPNYIDDDIEQQIFIVNPPAGTQAVHIHQPPQATITFTHPEPFLESRNSRTKPDSDNRFSPVSMSPNQSYINKFNKGQQYGRFPAPGSSVSPNYGAVIDPNDPGSQPTEDPPSYQAVMSETAKQYEQRK